MAINKTIAGLILGLGLSLGMITTAMAGQTDGPFQVLSVSCINESRDQRVCGMELNDEIIPSGDDRCTNRFVFWRLNANNKVLFDLALAAHLEQKEVFVVHNGCIDNTTGNTRPKVEGIQMR